jgi:peptidoglycan/xylan/chitin deacetylase (PgdA/CDA1 family)
VGNPAPPFLLTIDVEPDWGISGSKAVRETLPRFCRLLDKWQVRATFFVVADLLGECETILKETAIGHEIASHGLTHCILDSIDPGEMSRELLESRQRLEQTLQVEVKGFRAPFLRPGPNWFEALANAGYGYDSSIGSVAPGTANIYPSNWRPVNHGTIVELPIPSLVTGFIPCSLTYLRLLYPVGRRLVYNEAALLFLHLHELANPSLVNKLTFPLRLALKRGVGPKSWDILNHLLEQHASRAMTCSEFIAHTIQTA